MTAPAHSLAPLAPAYDAILSDVWGVLHDSIVAHTQAVDALRRYRQGGGKVVLITNAPRASAPIVAMLDRLGVTRDSYDTIVSSGDVTRAMIAPYHGKIIHHVGPATWDDTLYEGLGIIRGAPEEAEAVVVTDFDNYGEKPEMYRDRLTLWLKRDLPLICANPDRVVERGGRIDYCGGALADMYEAMGGHVVMVGKPYRPIYDEALKLAETAAGRRLDPARVLAIGDSVRTDAVGAANVGLDLVFITGSVHAEELGGSPDPATVAALVAPSGANMVGAMARLAW
jgi:HAD superfamily hydrolase (TIGR01459 family)